MNGRAVALLVTLLSGPAFAGPVEIAAGEKLAKRWCASCHLVSPDQPSASADAPSFAALAAGPGRAPEALADRLALPDHGHSKMPDMALSRVEIGDITAYIASLAK